MILTDYGIQFAEQPRKMICEADGIDHRLTKPTHPWTNGQRLPRRRPGSGG